MIFLPLSIAGIIRFGNGLGDLVYLFGLGVSAITTLLISIRSTQRVNQRKTIKNSGLLITVLLIVLIYFIYSFTIGRGVNAPWNGHIFYHGTHV